MARSCYNGAVKWLERTVDAECERARNALAAFGDSPSDDCLHDVRTTCRRLRSLLEDLSDCIPRSKLLKNTKRVAAWTDSPRDAAVMRELLERTVDESERSGAAQLFEALERRETEAGERARKKLARMELA